MAKSVFLTLKSVKSVYSEFEDTNLYWKSHSMTIEDIIACDKEARIKTSEIVGL